LRPQVRGFYGCGASRIACLSATQTPTAGARSLELTRADVPGVRGRQSAGREAAEADG